MILIIKLNIQKLSLYITGQRPVAQSLHSAEHKKWWKFDKNGLVLHLSLRIGSNLAV